MDFSKLSTNNWIAGGGGLLALIASILPWYSFDFGGIDLPGLDASVTAWGSGFAAWGGCILALAAGALVVLKATGIFEAKVGSLTTEQFAMILGALGFLLVLLRWLTETSFTAIGLYLGLIGSAAAAAGAFLSAKDLGVGLPSADDFTGGDGGGGDSSTF